MKYNVHPVKLSIIFLSFFLGACGGSSSGGAPAEGSGTALTIGTFKKIFGPVDNGSISIPFNDTFEYKQQYLYYANEVNGSGNITMLRFRRGADTVATISCPNFSIRLGHTSKTVPDLVSFGNNVEQGQGSLITVLDDATINIPIGSNGEWFEIPLATSFHYNGVNNLILEMENATACSASQLISQYGAGGTRMVMAAFTDMVPGTIEHSQTTAFQNDTSLKWVQFDFEGGDNFLSTAVGLLDGNSFPFTNNATTGRKIQLLYPASDVNGSGPITGIGFPVIGGSTEQSYTIDIRLGHSDLSALGATYADNFSDTPVTVASSLRLRVPAGLATDTVIWLPVTGSFDYNGTDNLILEIETVENSSATNDILWRNRSGTGGANTRLYGVLGATMGTPADDYYFTKFRFNGGTMDVIPPGTDGSTGYTFPFSADDGVRQILYHAAELGTAGQITSVGCRTTIADPAAQTGLTYSITLSHTSATTLVTDRATNLPAPAIVYTGTFDQPDFLGGDWFDIQLSTPFNYNGTDNLVVEFSGSGGTNGLGVGCRADFSNPTLHASRNAWNSASSSTTVSPGDAIFDMRFSIIK